LIPRRSSNLLTPNQTAEPRCSAGLLFSDLLARLAHIEIQEIIHDFIGRVALRFDGRFYRRRDRRIQSVAQSFQLIN
jgi:hypothetical protein